VASSRRARVPQELQAIKQVFDFLANRYELFALLMNRLCELANDGLTHNTLSVSPSLITRIMLDSRNRQLFFWLVKKLIRLDDLAGDG
jgi:hypothetical protein